MKYFNFPSPIHPSYMHFFLALAFILFFTTLSSRSQNLVPNPSFEDYTLCPDGTNQAERCVDWINFGMSPDYWGSCSNIPGTYLPSLGSGPSLRYQYPHSGDAIIGLVTWAKHTIPAGSNYREFMGSQLTSPTVIGQKYHASFYVNNSYVLGAASDKIGLRLSTVPFDSCCPPPLINFAHLYTDSIVTDTLGWTFVSGSFIADSVYYYVILGNLFDDLNTDTTALKVPPYNEAAYYFIDDVCLTTDSLYNVTWTGLSSISNKNLLIFPNPGNGLFHIKAPFHISEYKVFDSSGRSLLNEVVESTTLTVNIMPFSKGLYTLLLRVNNIWTSQKLFYIH